MGYLNNFNIGASVDSSCSYIEITDNNSYPITLDVGEERADIGIAVFWSLDNFSNVTGSDLTNATKWYIPSPITGTYSIRSYVVPIWAAGAWAINSIVEDNGSFYYTAAGTSDVPNPNADNGWAKLDGGDHATFQTHLYTGTIDYGYASISQDSTCKPYTINKTGVGLYTIVYAASSSNKLLSIQYYNRSSLSGTYASTITLTAGTTSYDVDLSAEGDAVFLFIIGDQGGTVYQYVVYEISALQACRNSMTQEVLQLCDDGCLDSCLNLDQAEEINLRHELNKLIILYSSVMSKINVESVTYLGIYTIDDTREAYINEVGDLVEKVNIIVESCGNCS